MNKMLSFIFWLFIPLLLPMMFLGLNEIDPGFYFYINSHFIKYDLFSIWAVISIYYFVLGYVYKKINVDNDYFAIQALITICGTFLFLKTMIDSDLNYSTNNMNFYHTRINYFYIGFFIWLFSQIWFWFKVVQVFSDQNNYDILDDSDF